MNSKNTEYKPIYQNIAYLISDKLSKYSKLEDWSDTFKKIATQGAILGMSLENEDISNLNKLRKILNDLLHDLQYGDFFYGMNDTDKKNIAEFINICHTNMKEYLYNKHHLISGFIRRFSFHIPNELKRIVSKYYTYSSITLENKNSNVMNENNIKESEQEKLSKTAYIEEHLRNRFGDVVTGLKYVDTANQIKKIRDFDGDYYDSEDAMNHICDKDNLDTDDESEKQVKKHVSLFFNNILPSEETTIKEIELASENYKNANGL